MKKCPSQVHNLSSSNLNNLKSPITPLIHMNQEEEINNKLINTEGNEQEEKIKNPILAQNEIYKKQATKNYNYERQKIDISNQRQNLHKKNIRDEPSKYKQRNFSSFKRIKNKNNYIFYNELSAQKHDYSQVKSQPKDKIEEEDKKQFDNNYFNNDNFKLYLYEEIKRCVVEEPKYKFGVPSPLEEY